LVARTVEELRKDIDNPYDSDEDSLENEDNLTSLTIAKKKLLPPINPNLKVFRLKIEKKIYRGMIKFQ